MYCANANSIAWKSFLLMSRLEYAKIIALFWGGGGIFLGDFSNSNFELFKHAPPRLEQPDTLALSNEDL